MKNKVTYSEIINSNFRLVLAYEFDELTRETKRIILQFRYDDLKFIVQYQGGGQVQNTQFFTLKDAIKKYNEI